MLGFGGESMWRVFAAGRVERALSEAMPDDNDEEEELVADDAAAATAAAAAAAFAAAAKEAAEAIDTYDCLAPSSPSSLSSPYVSPLSPYPLS